MVGFQAMLELNNLKRVAEKLDPERDEDKKSLIEITDRQFEVNMLDIMLNSYYLRSSKRLHIGIFNCKIII